MSKIILPPVPPRPPHQVRPTLTPVPETPGNKGVKVLMVKGPGDGTEPPGPEYNDPLVKDKAQWDINNKYETGQVITAYAATWREGNPETQEIRSRWQIRATADDDWTNTPWTGHFNEQRRFDRTLVDAGEVRFQSQVRDTSFDPVAQVNSFCSVEDVTEPPPPTTIGAPTIYIDDVECVYGQAIHVPVDTPVNAAVTITGDASPSYKWEARGDYPMMVGEQAATTTLTFTEVGSPTVTMTITDSTATDSPVTYAMMFYVASQQEWEMLHPTAIAG